MSKGKNQTSHYQLEAHELQKYPWYTAEVAPSGMQKVPAGMHMGRGGKGWGRKTKQRL